MVKCELFIFVIKLLFKSFKKKVFKKNQCEKISKAGSINCDEKSKKQTLSLKNSRLRIYNTKKIKEFISENKPNCFMFYHKFISLFIMQCKLNFLISWISLQLRSNHCLVNISVNIFSVIAKDEICGEYRNPEQQVIYRIKDFFNRKDKNMR